jgi:hypothetical protein
VLTLGKPSADISLRKNAVITLDIAAADKAAR